MTADDGGSPSNNSLKDLVFLYFALYKKMIFLIECFAELLFDFFLKVGTSKRTASKRIHALKIMTKK